MSAKPRCHHCKHRRGARALGKLATNAKTHEVTTKKAPCQCKCHEPLEELEGEGLKA